MSKRGLKSILMSIQNKFLYLSGNLNLAMFLTVFIDRIQDQRFSRRCSRFDDNTWERTGYLSN